MVYRHPVVVFVTDENGASRQAGECHPQNLGRASAEAAEQLRASETKSEVFFDGSVVDSHSVDKICDWINSINFASKDLEEHGLEVSFAGPNPTFEQIVLLHSTGYYMRCPATLRGQHLENEIWKYMHENCLSLRQFKMIMEWIPFSKLCKAAKDGIVYQKVHGPVPPEMAQIEQYCEENGMLDDLTNYERHILRIKAHHEKQAAEAAERERKKAEYQKKQEEEAEYEKKQEEKAEYEDDMRAGSYAAAARGNTQ
ncbi:Hypothetical predicted protein [Lecanosticta acicola]|uniref:Uncharacterized protein n=1 Tax=Lecanosticta acicola TaxID=111012 RepID=A0AAI9EE17_9PEZI|nr:Hypothetical predicted protein [Lecanosticta acicola]